ncbi:magnesium-translocating P-type ATPase, partial [Candidatus Bathyarchaeota archaeon]|nr:magnesium-translocating P-type ATPase [Candidatus Bathyarchaeota archaeon]
YWSAGPSEVYLDLATGEHGLSEQEAQRRLKTYGYNELPRQAFSGFQVLLRQFKNPIFVILIACAIVAGLFAELKQSIVILSMIVLSVILGFVNEYRAEKTVEDMRRSVSIKAVVTRDGKLSEVDARLVVPGDLVSVYVGDIVPADMKIIEAKSLQANEATLTGESFPVEKTAEALELEHPTPQQLANYLFMGTVVSQGAGKAVVVSTGKNTEFGSISKSLARPHPETEFQRGVRNYGTLLLTLSVVLAIGIFALNALVGHPIIDSLLFSLAVAIGLVPELMPAIVTISLSQGSRRMAKKRVVVKRLVSIEDFGNMNILCTDKTGTLTEGNVILKECRPLKGRVDPRVLPYSLLCNSTILGEKIIGNPMDIAVWDYAIKNGLKESINSYSKIEEIPFDYQRRMMSVVVRHSDELVFITKGAPESVLAKCRYVAIDERTDPISVVLGDVDSDLRELSEAGYRVLAVACKNMESKTSYSAEDELDLTFLGFLVFTDPPKLDADKAIARLKAMGVSTKILTGDNPLVAVKICSDLKVPVEGVVNGSELLQMSATEIRSVVEETSIFARITPEQKLDVIKALKANGHVVGFLGDGVNDAPALYEADVGISVDTAVDVSKDAADIVLLDKDLLVLANGIEEGRKIFGNTIKYILMGTSSNFGNMFSAAAASVFLPFLPMLPMQILFMNLLYDIANFTLPTDNVDEEYTKWPKRWDMNFVRKYTLFFGPFSSLYDFLTYGIMLFIFSASPALFQSGWFVESFWTEVLVMFVIRTRRIPFFTSRPGKWLMILTFSCIAFGTIMPFTILGDFLGFTALPPDYWALLILMVVTYLFLVDAGKVFFYKICKF